MRLDGYIRVSRTGGRAGESFISPQQQRDQIEAYAKAHGMTIDEWFTDLDQSGGHLDRPEFTKALERARDGLTDGVIAAKLDRLSRSLSGLAQLIKQARKEDWNLVAVDHGLDLKSPNGGLVANILGSVAQWELEQRRAGWDDAQGRAVARGVHVASRTPTGYLRKENGRLVPDAHAAPVIRELFLRRAGGHGWTALARYLDESQVRGPYGNPTWTPSATQKLVRNRAYLGEARSGKHVNPGAHAPLVSRAEWEAAQGKIAVRSVRQGDGLLLTGLVRCAGCRYLLKADHMKGRNGERLGIYRCRGRHSAGECSAPATIMARVLDPYIEQMFLEAVGPSGPLAEEVDVSIAVDDALAAIDAAEAALADYRDDRETERIIGRERFNAGLEVRVADVRDAQAKLSELTKGTKNMRPAMRSALVVEWPTLDVTAKRHLLVASLDAVVVRSGRADVADRARLLWAGEAPDDFPRRGFRVPLEPFVFGDEPEAAAEVPALAVA
jgi:DNA invertase Pin-like site-specific DNA recombinase